MENPIRHRRGIVSSIVCAGLLSILLTTGLPVFAQTSVEVTGSDTIILDNKKGIHHESNIYSKNLVRRGAIYNAIEKGAGIRITRKVFSATDDNGEQNFQEYFERILEQYNVNWNVTSEEFIPITKKKFVCTVKGIVTSDRPESIDFGSANDHPEFKELYFITDKRFNKVTINYQFNKGAILGVTKTIRRKTVSGITEKEVVKGVVRVEYEGDHYSEARILRGMLRVHKKNSIDYMPDGFNTNRIGFGYEYSADALPASSDLSSYGKNFSSHTIYFYLQSYVTRFGMFLGYEVIQCYQINPGKIQYLNAGYLGLDYTIGLVPGILYLRPGFNLGYVADNDILKDSYWGQPKGKWDANVILNPRLMGVLRFQKVEIYGGVSYKYANDLPALSNSFTTVGLRVNLGKY